MSDAPRIVVKSDPSITPEQARNARARALRYALDCYFQRQQTLGASREKAIVIEEGSSA